MKSQKEHEESKDPKSIFFGPCPVDEKKEDELDDIDDSPSKINISAPKEQKQSNAGKKRRKNKKNKAKRSSSVNQDIKAAEESNEEGLVPELFRDNPAYKFVRA